MAVQQAADGMLRTPRETFWEIYRGKHPMANYLTHWSQHFRYIYVETPKVACTSIKRTLQAAEIDGTPPEQTHDRKASPLKAPNHDRAAFDAALVDPAVVTFAFVRNPFDRILSCFLDKIATNAYERNRLAPKLGLPPERPVPFGTFLEAVRAHPEAERDIHWASQRFILRPRRMRYHFIGRFENFDAGFAAVLSRVGIDHRHVTRKAPHATGAADKRGAYYGAKEVALVQEVYEDDFLTFGYGWDPTIG